PDRRLPPNLCRRNRQCRSECERWKTSQSRAYKRPPRATRTSLCRLQLQPMLGGSVHRCIGKRQRERCSAVPGGELIFVMRAEQMAGLAGDDVKRGMVEIGEIHRHALGWTKISAHLLHRAPLPDCG